MKNIILFIAAVACIYIGYDRFGRRSVFPKVITEGVVRQKANTSGKDSFFVEMNHKIQPVVYVLSKKGMWEGPKKDSVVTAFVTAKNQNLQFMAGRVDDEAIDRAFQGQILRIVFLFAMLGLAVLCDHYQYENDEFRPKDVKE